MVTLATLPSASNPTAAIVTSACAVAVFSAVASVDLAIEMFCPKPTFAIAPASPLGASAFGSSVFGSSALTIGHGLLAGSSAFLTA
jgi:hypothetical protein